jgi:hypothetical protein
VVRAAPRDHRDRSRRGDVNRLTDPPQRHASASRPGTAASRRGRRPTQPGHRPGIGEHLHSRAPSGGRTPTARPGHGPPRTRSGSHQPSPTPAAPHARHSGSNRRMPCDRPQPGGSTPPATRARPNPSNAAGDTRRCNRNRA